ncbi:hypothetical protein TMHG_01864, partial [Mycobacterium tuberculosis SUMu008]
GVTKLSKSQVSIMAKELDEARRGVSDPPARCRPVYLPRRRRPGAQGARGRPRRRGAHLDRHRRQRRGLPRDPGHPGHLRRGRAGWLAFFRDLVARGLSGVALVTSDAHAGLVAAIGATLPAAAWQRCRTHYAANHGRHNA